MKRVTITAMVAALLLTLAPLALANASQNSDKNSGNGSEKAAAKQPDKATKQAAQATKQSEKAAGKADKANGKADKAAGKADKAKAHGNGGSKFQLEGVVVSFDAATQTLVVTVKSGSKTIKAFRGLPLTIIVAADARMVDGSSESGPGLTAEALTAGSKVHVGGVIDRTDPAAAVFTATKVILQVAAAPIVEPTIEPTVEPTVDPSVEPTVDPTVDPTAEPSVQPTIDPTTDPSAVPDPSVSPVVFRGLIGHVSAWLAVRF